MNRIEELKKKFSEIKISDSFTEHNNFLKLLTADNSIELLEFHFSLIKERENSDLHRRIAKAFEKHYTIGEDFLLNKLINENLDEETSADTIQILGLMKSKKLLPYLPNLLKSNSELIRYKAIIVSGWLGSENEVDLLKIILMHDNESYLRGYSATAMRQIWFSHDNLKNKILENLFIALKIEAETDALALIIVSIQELLKRKFGLKEVIGEGTIKGDVEKSKVKIIKDLQL